MEQKFWVPGKFEETLKNKNVTSQVMTLYICVEKKIKYATVTEQEILWEFHYLKRNKVIHGLETTYGPRKSC